MKVQAKNIKVGMTIRWGVVSITVESINEFTQKNGIKGKVFYGSAIRTMGKGFKPIKIGYTDITVKNDTFLNIKQ